MKDLALKVKKVVEKQLNKKGKIKINYTKSKDVRSYRINSDKIYKILKFKPIFSLENAITELCSVFKRKLLKQNLNNDIYYNVERLKNLKIK